MLNQNVDKQQVLLNFLRQLAALEQKITVDHIIGLLPERFIQRLHRPSSNASSSRSQQSWRKPRSLVEMAEDFSLSPRCGALINEIFSARPRMAYTQHFKPQLAFGTLDKFGEDESMAMKELEYWLHNFMDNYDQITKW